MTKTRYVSTNLTPTAYAAVRRLGLEQSIALGRRVTMSEVVTALGRLAEQHGTEFSDLIKTPPREGDPQ